MIFEEISSHLLNDAKPSIYLENLIMGKLNSIYPFTMLYKLKDTKQSPKYHPEGNVWNHTMMVVNEAAIVREISKNQIVFMWAALLHDIGKIDTTRVKKNGRITSYDHDRVGVRLSREILDTLIQDNKLVCDKECFIDEVTELVRWHMHILYVVNKLPFGDVDKLVKTGDIDEIALLGWCDRMGRTNSDPMEEEINIKKFIEICYFKRKYYQVNKAIMG